MIQALIWGGFIPLLTLFITLRLIKRYVPLDWAQWDTWLVPWFNLCILVLADTLLPWDIATKGATLFYYLWMVTYGVQFVLCWLGLPILISYQQLQYSIYSIHDHETNSLIKWKRLYGSVIQNVKYYTIMLIATVIAFMFALVTLSIHSIWPIVISLSHLYSLSFTLTLLAMGLIIVPRDLAQRLFSRDRDIINKLYIALSHENDELNDSKLYLWDHSLNILESVPLNNGDVEFNDMLSLCQRDVKEHMDLLDNIDRLITDTTDEGPTQIKNVDALNKEWNQFLTHFYTIQFHQYQIDKLIHSLAKQSGGTTVPMQDDVILQFSQPWIVKARHFMTKSFIFVCFVLSVLFSTFIILLELLPTKLTNWIIWNRLPITQTSLILFIILIYNKFITLYSMTIIKFQNFHLTPNGQSNPTNLLYFILYGNRLLFPLYFNVMTFFQTVETCQFNNLLYEQLTLIPLINWLNKWLPPCFIIVIMISYYNNNWKWQLLSRFISEDTLYQLFGWFNLDDYNEEGAISNNTNPINSGDNERLSISTNTDASNLNDIEYSLQDGRFLFERAINNKNNSNDDITNSNNGTMMYTDNNSQGFNQSNEPTRNTGPGLSDYFNN